MNIRIGEGAVRFRISCEELELLLTGKNLEETLILAGKPVLLTVEPSGEGGELGLVYEEGRIGLRASSASLQELNQKGRQKGGLSYDIGGSAVSLQVDLKTYSRAKQG